MKEQGATRQFDALLLPLLQATEGVESESVLARLLSAHAAPVIKAVIRSKLGVSLSASDGRFENQEALEIENDVAALLVVEMNGLRGTQGRNAIGNFRSYVAAVTFHACSGYLRRKNPERGQLKSSLRYLLTTRPDFALWQGAEKDWLCGLKWWEGREPARTGAGLPAQNVNGPRGLAHLKLQGRRDVEYMPLEELLPEILRGAGQPVAFEELVNFIAGLKGISDRARRQDADEEEAQQELARLPDPRADVAAELDQRIYLQKLWTEIVELPPKQRAALLLNLRDAQGRGMIAMFPLTSVAGIPQLAATLEIPLEQFAAIWNELPWEDASIALRLGVTRQQVVNLRKCARERLSRRMKGF
jgi:hypothetical protein